MKDSSVVRAWHLQGPNGPFHVKKKNNIRHIDQKVKLGSVSSVCWNKDSSLKNDSCLRKDGH